MKELDPRYEGPVRLVVLAVALGLLLVVESAASTDADLGGITLASVGFVILAAFTVGELGRVAKLPRITGYILAGVVMGPHVSDLLSALVVRDMAVFNTLALGLIALTAGLELGWASLEKVARTLLVTLAAKLPLLLAAIGGTFVLLEHFFGFTGIETQEGRLVAAGVLGVLGIGTSPAIVLAVASETGAKGRLTNLVLGMAVVKDLVVVTVLAVALAIGQGMLDPDADVGLSSLTHVAEELLGSIALGGAIGGLLLAYIRFIHQQMLLVVVVVVLLGAEATEFLHLELLLVFIAAGFVVRNFSSKAEQLHHPLERVSLPVFVVFFTTAGATVNLKATLGLLPLAAALVLARAAANFGAARFGAWAGNEPEAPRRYAWLSYWPQAGVTLGLVKIAAERLPSISDELERTGFAVVALNLLVGPVALGIGLRKAGEAVPSRGPKRDASKVEAEPRAEGPPPIPPLPEPTPPVDEVIQTLITTDPPRTEVEKLSASLEWVIDSFVERQVAPFAAETSDLALKILGEAEETAGVLAGVRKALGNQERAPESADWAAKTTELRDELSSLLIDLPARMNAPLPVELLCAKDKDDVLVRAQKAALRAYRRVNAGQARTRTIPLRLLGRYALELRLIEGVRALGRTSFEHHAVILDEVRAVFEDRSTPAQARDRVQQWRDRWVQAARLELQTAARKGVLELVHLAADAGAPGSEARRIRLSRQQTAITNARTGAQRDPARWRQVADAGIATLRGEALLAELEEKLGAITHRRLIAPLAQVSESMAPLIKQVGNRVDTVLETLEADTEKLDLEGAERNMGAAVKKDKNALEKAARSYANTTRLPELADAFDDLIAAAPERISVLMEAPSFVASERLPVVEVPLRARLEERLDRFAARVRENMVRIERSVQEAERLTIQVQAVQHALTSAGTVEGNAELRRNLAVRSITRFRDRVRQLDERMLEEVPRATEAVEKAAEETRRALPQLLAGAREGGTVARVGETVRARGRALRARIGRLSTTTSSWVGRLLVRAFGLSITRPAPREIGALRAELESELPPIAQLDLPPEYRRVFELGPLSDKRLDAAHQDVLARLRARVDQQPGVHTILEAAPGMGRSTLLAFLKRSSKKRVIFPRPGFRPRDRGLVGALAARLDCPDYPIAVSQALSSQETVIVVDDLPLYVPPDPDGFAELRELLRVVIDTSPTTNWVLSAPSGYVDLLRPHVPSLSVFTERERLPEVDADTLEAVIGARTELSGIELRYPRRGIGRREGRVRRGRNRYFELLAEASKGNLRDALVLHLRSLTRLEEDVLLAHWPESPPAARLEELEPRAVACLATLARFGAFDERELSDYLFLGAEETRGHLHALSQAGLLDRREVGGFRSSRQMQQSILCGLERIAQGEASG